MRLRGVARLLLLLLATASSHAAGWTRTSSDHFEIYTTAGGPRAREALAYFEQVRGFFDRFLSLPPSTRPATRVILFSSASDFEPYRVSATSAAYFQPARDHDYIVLSHLTGDAEPVIVHEYAHLAIDRSGATYPPWLSEGLAEFFSTLVPARGRVLLGAAPLGRVAALAQHELLPLARLLRVTRDAPEYLADHSGVFYAESWALTHMLIAGERYQARVDRFLALVARGTPAAEALTAVFETSLPDIERELRRYITRGYFRQLSVPGDMSTTGTVADTVPIDVFDANLVLANLLAGSRGREAQARTAFAALARERPDDTSLTTSRGLFEALNGHDDDARGFLERAVRLKTRDALAIAELARLIEPTDALRAGALLEQALVLAPADPLIRIRRASNMVSRGLGAQALDETARIQPVSPEQQFLYFQVVANAHALLGQFDEAAAAGTKVLDTATTSGERRFAEGLIERVRAPAGVTDMVVGRLNSIACNGPSPVLEVITDQGILHLVVDDPSKVLVPGGGSVDLNCGPQNRPVRVGYGRANPPRGTNGRLRFLEFKEARPPFR